MITIDYFSDVLCVWAYGGQIRVDELRQQFPDDVILRHRFIPVFADTCTRIERGWQEQGGFQGFSDHLVEVCDQWQHTHVEPDLWVKVQPTTSITAHVLLKAVWLVLGLDGEQQSPEACQDFNRLQWDVRRAFFEQGLDVSSYQVLWALLEDYDLARDDVAAMIESGRAYAALHQDDELKREYCVQGSPTFVFNEGRQVLYGNVGYRIIESNIRELLQRSALHDDASWC